MSTPTTANPTVPPRYNPQHYPHYQHHSGPYPPASAAYRQPAASAVLSSSSTRLPPPYAAAPAASAGYPAPSGGLAGTTPGNSVPRSDAAYHSTMPTASASFGSPAVAAQSDSLNSRKRRRDPNGPNWNEFYKNGLPSEIIVIDDTPEPDNGSTASYTATAATALANGTSVDSSQPLAKRRKRDDAHIESPYQTRHLLSQASTPRHHSPTTSASSSGRTTSAAHTTAATSIGSASSNSQYDYETVPGQKRKRTARQQVNDNKRLQAELAQDLLRYRTPPQPIKKASEIKVPVIPDKSYRRNDLKYDDDDGHYIVVPEADLTEDYQMLQLLGQGTFGKVVKARDKKRSKFVAIKIIRSVQKYRDASKIELRVLATLKANDPENRNRCIHFRDYFDFRNHICIVTDLLDVSVFDFLKSNNYVPFPNSQIQHFARQLFTSVAFLHDLNLIHTDLKPENILLCNSAYQTFTYNRKIPSSSTAVVRQANQRKVLLDTEIRLIDFGSATFQDEYHSQVVSTRHYRAPEIMLGLGWSFECDIWSIGCILVEFFTGDALFQTHDNLEHLAMMEAVVGSRIDTALITLVNKGTRGSNNPASQYFKRHKLDYPKPETTRASKRYVKGMKQLRSIIPSTNTFLRHFLDLLEKIFVYDPKKRIKAKEALKHPWFQEAAYPDDGTEAAKIRRERMSQDLPGSRTAPFHV